MYPDVEEHVRRAADEFRAAHAAVTEAARKAHIEMAAHYIRLIQARGSTLTLRYVAAREAAGSND